MPRKTDALTNREVRTMLANQSDAREKRLSVERAEEARRLMSESDAPGVDTRSEPTRRRLPTFRREYATYIIAYSDKPNMILEFGQHGLADDGQTGVVDVVVGLVMPAAFAKRMVDCVQKQIARYEDRYGPIPMD